MLGLEVGHLLAPCTVEELEAHATGLVLDLVLELLAGHVLVHEALAVAVELEEARAAHAAAHVVDHGGVGAGLEHGAREHTHALAVAGVGHAALGGRGREERHDAVGLGRVVVEHLGVAADVAGGEVSRPWR